MSPSIEQLLHDANPARQTDVDRLDLGDAAESLKTSIVQIGVDEPAPAAAAAAPVRTTRRRRWPVLVGISTALAVVALFTLVSLGRLGGGSSGSGEAWAASALRLARSVPRVLPADQTWKVIYADQHDATSGELRVKKGNREVDLNWYPRSSWDTYLKDRSTGNIRYPDATAAGHTAAMFRYAEPTDDYFAMWQTGNLWIEARTAVDIPPKWQNKPIPAGVGPNTPTFFTHFDRAAFAAFIGDLREVSVDAWLRRMPASVVKPADADATVHEMLKDIPTPPGFDVSKLIDDTAPRDPYQLGAKVVGAVVCGWISQWFAARADGNVAAERKAVAALQTSRHWKVMLSMQKSGAYPEVVWEMLDSMERGKVDNGLGDYRGGLGCPG